MTCPVLKMALTASLAGGYTHSRCHRTHMCGRPQRQIPAHMSLLRGCRIPGTRTCARSSSFLAKLSLLPFMKMLRPGYVNKVRNASSREATDMRDTRRWGCLWVHDQGYSGSDDLRLLPRWSRPSPHLLPVQLLASPRILLQLERARAHSPLRQAGPQPPPAGRPPLRPIGAQAFASPFGHMAGRGTASNVFIQRALGANPDDPSPGSDALYQIHKAYCAAHAHLSLAEAAKTYRALMLQYKEQGTFFALGSRPPGSPSAHAF